MKKEILKVLGLAGTVGLLLGGCGGEERAEASTKSPRRHGKIAQVASATNKVAKVQKRKKLRRKLSKKERKALALKRVKARAEAISKALATPPADLSAADKRIFTGLRDALDGENYSEVRRFALAAQKSPSAELRSDAVRALSWFGAKGLASLTSYLDDADVDVAGEAQRAWEAGLMEIEDEAVKLQYIETAMSGIDDELMLDAISQNYNQLADEAAAVESMMRVVSKGGIGAEKAKEAYAFMTGEDWTDAGAAAKWVAAQRAEAGQEAAGSGDGAAEAGVSVGTPSAEGGQ